MTGWMMCLLTTSPTIATAQTEPTHPTIQPLPEQLTLNNEAAEALNQSPSDATTAIAKIEAALKLGPGFDLLYMTLGRAYQYQDQCRSARETFTLSEKAPGIDGIPHDVIVEKLRRYMNEESTLCSGTLVLACSDSSVSFRSDGQQFLCHQPVALQPGTRRVEVLRDDSVEESFNVFVEGMKQNTLVIGRDITLTTVTIERSNAAKLARPVLVTGVVTTLAGIGLSTAGLIPAFNLDNELENRNLTFPEAEARRSRRNTLYIAGGATTILGVGALITGIVLNTQRKKEEANIQSATLTLWPTHDGAQMMLEARF